LAIIPLSGFLDVGLCLGPDEEPIGGPRDQVRFDSMRSRASSRGDAAVGSAR
jgi:hypothetical protein